MLTEDLTRWNYWWELNKDRYLDLKVAVHTPRTTTHSDQFYMGVGKVRVVGALRPTRRQIQERILPTIHTLMTATRNRDIVTAGMVALAKIGQDHKSFEIQPLFASYLKRGDQEIRETAALAMGISGDPRALSSLTGLLLDMKVGRGLVGRAEVDDRTRAFAGYALGLIARSTPRVDAKRRVFQAAQDVLLGKVKSSRDVRIAAVTAIGMIRPDWESAKGKRLLEECLASLVSYYQADFGSGELLIQAHAPTAIAKLLQGRPADRSISYYKQMFLREITKRRRSNYTLQSTVLALGQLSLPYVDSASPDAEISKALLKVFEKGKNKQAAYFSLVALGQIGGARNRDALLEVLRRGVKAIERPWAALALGILCRRAADQAESVACVDPFVGRRLLDALMGASHPDLAGALAVAIGLSRYREGAEKVRVLAERTQHQDALSGYLCLSLALMDDQHSIDTIQKIISRSIRRPELLRQGAVALGMLGDKSAGPLLLKVLHSGQHIAARMGSAAVGLGLIGDRLMVEPLLTLVKEESLTKLARAMSIAALGGVADKDLLPWSEGIASNINYRATVSTLTNQHSGILDIL